MNDLPNTLVISNVSRRGLLKGLMASTAAVAASGALPKMVGAAAAAEADKAKKSEEPRRKESGKVAEPV